jgi:ribosome modulation factor
MPRGKRDETAVMPRDNNGLAPEDFLTLYRAIKDTKRLKDEAAAAHKAARENFKAAGGDLNAMKIVDHLQGLDDAEAELRMRETLRYAAWLGLEIGTQTELFGSAPQVDLTASVASQHREWEAEQAGYKAGKASEPIDNCPHSGGSPYFSRWRQGWNDGQAALAMTLKPKDDEAV